MNVCRCYDCRKALRQDDYFLCYEVTTSRHKEFCMSCYEEHKGNPALELQFPRLVEEKINWVSGGF